MRILYDHQAFTYQKFGGVSKCFSELIANMPPEVKTKIAVRESDNVHLLESDLSTGIKRAKMDYRRWKNIFPFKGSGIILRSLDKLGILRTAETENLKYSIELLKKKEYDVFHPTFFDPYFLKYIENKPWVLTVHDMMPELFPKYFKQDDMQIEFKKKYLNQAAAIIAVSENTKKDIVRHLGISEERITVVYHGGPTREIVKAPSLIAAPYFLYVGAREYYKNFPQTLEDFADFHHNYAEVKLVCTGSGFTSLEKKRIQELGLSDAILHICANEHEMKVLYANAVAFIYPSLYEGFGMPILEAFAYGCPALLNHRSCFPEIAANAGVYFDSEPGKSNLSEIMKKIYLLSNEDRKVIAERGFDRLRDFSWKTSAEKLANVYRDICL